MDTLMERQALLEAEMQGRGAARFRERTERALSRNDSAGTQPGTYLTKRVIQPMVEVLTRWLEEVNTGRAGPRNRAALLLEGLDIETVAFLTAKTAISYSYASSNKLARLSRGIPLTTLANTLGLAVEDEQRMALFEKLNPALFSKVSANLTKEGATEQHRRTVLIYAMGKFDVAWDRWPLNDRIRLGTKLLELLAEASDVIEINLALLDVTAKAKAKKQVYIVSPSEAVDSWFMAELERSALLSPVLLPTIIPPKEWKGISGGGYHTNAVRPYGLVKSAQRAHKEKLLDADLDVVLYGVNTLQNTPWAVNEGVLRVFDACVQQGLLGGTKELAQHEEVKVPERPDPERASEEEMREWRHQARAAHTENIKRRSNLIRQQSLLDTAMKFLEERAIYFPHQLDTRGRAYPVPVLFNPQGSDLTKALLTFEKGIELGTETAADWLKVHGANVWGNDKVPFEDRIEFIEEMTPTILSYAEDPLANPGWTEADKPWCFLAFCFEYAGYMREGLRFKSRIPIALDGSCNGLQHFSAMLLDPVGGKAVNLTPSDRPQDIYQAVADRATERLRQMAEEGGDQAWMAEAWVQFKIDRAITKRPVMVLPYGGTPRSCLRYVEEAVRTKIDMGRRINPFGDELSAAILLLSKTIWDSIGDVVVAARAAMDWLQQVARVVSKTGQPIHWTTPSGFVAFQGYWDYKQRAIKTKLNGSIIQLYVPGDPIKIDSRKQATGISPNFVHSMDAAAMFLTMYLLRDYGIVDFAMIHDSYGTHAANTEALSQAIRQAFVQMYSTPVLEEFRSSIVAMLPDNLAKKVPPVPPSGSLNLLQVLSSEFFFA